MWRQITSSSQVKDAPSVPVPSSTRPSAGIQPPDSKDTSLPPPDHTMLQEEGRIGDSQHGIWEDKRQIVPAKLREAEQEDIVQQLDVLKLKKNSQVNKLPLNRDSTCEWDQFLKERSKTLQKEQQSSYQNSTSSLPTSIMKLLQEEGPPKEDVAPLPSPVAIRRNSDVDVPDSSASGPQTNYQNVLLDPFQWLEDEDLAPAPLPDDLKPTPNWTRPALFRRSSSESDLIQREANSKPNVHVGDDATEPNLDICNKANPHNPDEQPQQSTGLTEVLKQAPKEALDPNRWLGDKDTSPVLGVTRPGLLRRSSSDSELTKTKPKGQAGNHTAPKRSARQMGVRKVKAHVLEGQKLDKYSHKANPDVVLNPTKPPERVRIGSRNPYNWLSDEDVAPQDQRPSSHVQRAGLLRRSSSDSDLTNSQPSGEMGNGSALLSGLLSRKPVTDDPEKPTAKSGNDKAKSYPTKAQAQFQRMALKPKTCLEEEDIAPLPVPQNHKNSDGLIRPGLLRRSSSDTELTKSKPNNRITKYQRRIPAQPKSEEEDLLKDLVGLMKPKKQIQKSPLNRDSTCEWDEFLQNRATSLQNAQLEGHNKPSSLPEPLQKWLTEEEKSKTQHFCSLPAWPEQNGAPLGGSDDSSLAWPLPVQKW